MHDWSRHQGKAFRLTTRHETCERAASGARLTELQCRTHTRPVWRQKSSDPRTGGFTKLGARLTELRCSHEARLVWRHVGARLREFDGVFLKSTFSNYQHKHNHLDTLRAVHIRRRAVRRHSAQDIIT